MSSPSKWRVVKEYQAAYPDPLAFQAGEEVSIARRESEWPGWLWCTKQSGESRWVPEQYIERGGKTAVMRCGYDATELTVHIGETLTAHREASDWLWCTNQQGGSGWVPAANLECL